MNYEEALSYINSASWLGSKPGLGRVTELLSRLGDPQNELRFVHVAGTNGKGSCSAMLASVLKKAGLRTGLFSSPYIQRFNERMQINGAQIEDAALASLIDEIKPHAEAMEEHATVFEMMCAAALLWFKNEGCDIVVMEVGLGGRFDATNVIPTPLVSVITAVGLDHTEILGDSLEEIAYEKAGIIKEGSAVVMYQQSSEVMNAVRDVCLERNAELIVPDFDDISPEFQSLEGQVFSYRGEAYAIPLLGEHQLYNTVVCIEALKVLIMRGLPIERNAIEAGLYSVSWPARFELVNAEPPVLLDGAHNPQAALALSDSLRQYFGDMKRVLLLGVLRDKDYESIVRILAPLFDAFVTVTPPSERALPAKELAACLSPYGKELQVADSIDEGVKTAMDIADELEGMVCACGSLYSCGEIRTIFRLK